MDDFTVIGALGSFVLLSIFAFIIGFSAETGMNLSDKLFHKDHEKSPRP